MSRSVFVKGARFGSYVLTATPSHVFSNRRRDEVPEEGGMHFVQPDGLALRALHVRSSGPTDSRLSVRREGQGVSGRTSRARQACAARRDGPLRERVRRQDGTAALLEAVSSPVRRPPPQGPEPSPRERERERAHDGPVRAVSRDEEDRGLGREGRALLPEADPLPALRQEPDRLSDAAGAVWTRPADSLGEPFRRRP